MCRLCGGCRAWHGRMACSQTLALRDAAALQARLPGNSPPAQAAELCVSLRVLTLQGRARVRVCSAAQPDPGAGPAGGQAYLPASLAAGKHLQHLLLRRWPCMRAAAETACSGCPCPVNACLVPSLPDVSSLPDPLHCRATCTSSCVRPLKSCTSASRRWVGCGHPAWAGVRGF